jgi:hypothetical protein
MGDFEVVRGIQLQSHWTFVGLLSMPGRWQAAYKNKEFSVDFLGHQTVCGSRSALDQSI